jgi:hypothetical protein
MKGLKLKPGDIFAIPIDEGKEGFGQIAVIPNKSNFIVVIFEKAYDRRQRPALDAIVQDKILFQGYTMDALLYHKEWPLIGNVTANLKEIKLPYYKLGTPPDCKLVNYEGKTKGKISREIFDKLNYQKVIAPIRYENALKAFHQIGEWRQDYDELRYEVTLESISVVE